MTKHKVAQQLPSKGFAAQGMQLGVNRDQSSVLDIIDETMDRCVFWNGLVILHSIDIPLDTGVQVSPDWHEVFAGDAVLCLRAQTPLHCLQM